MALFNLVNILVLIFLSTLFSNFSILVIGIIGLLLVLYLAKGCNPKIYSNLSFIYFVSVVLMLVIYFGYIAEYGTPYFGGGSDDLAFEVNAKYVIDNNYILPEQLSEDPQLQFHNSKGFLWILSWIMRVSDIFGGYHTITFRVLNVYFLLALSILVFRSFENNYQFTFKQNLTVLYAMALFPNVQYISLHVFRDTISILLLFSLFFLWDSFFDTKRIKKRSYKKTIIFTFLFFYVAYWIRHENIIFMGAILLFSLLLKNKKLSIRNFILFFLTAIIGITLVESFNLWELVGAFNERYTEHKLEISDGLSNIVFSIPIFPLGIFIRMVYALISPVPVTVLQFTDMFANVKTFFNVIIGVGVIVQIYLLPYLFKNIKETDKFALSFIILLMGIAVTTFTFRHFIMLYPFMIILIFRKFFKTGKVERNQHLIIMTVVLVIFASLYMLIK